MIQRAIGVSIGAIVSLVLLLLATTATVDQLVVPLAIGAIAAWAWPVVIVWFLARRVKQRRENEIQSEVSRQMKNQ